MPTSPTGNVVPRSGGFTLLEMLIAMSISGMILVVAYGTFAGVNRAKRTIEAHDGISRHLSHACEVIRRDLRAAMPPPSGESGKNVWNSAECQFSLLVEEGKQAAVRYRLEKGRLMRQYAPDKVDRKARKGSAGAKSLAPIAEGVHKVAFSYFADNSWQDRIRPKQWPDAVRLSLWFKQKNGKATVHRHVVRLEVR